MTGTAERYEQQALGCALLGSPFYARLLERLAADARAGGPADRVLADFAERPGGDAPQLRLLGGIHRMVLTGELPDLARHFPSAGGDGDADAAWPLVRGLLADLPGAVADALTRPPQTNEVGRAGPLGGGLAVVAGDTGLPLRLFELGTSAGLNLRLDRFHHEADDRTMGDPTAAVRFVDLWDDGAPPYSAIEVVERRGCDRSPLDPADEADRLTLLSYLWPDQAERRARTEAAIEVAQRVPAEVERADIGTWLADRLDLVDGTATVVFHSIVWQYLEPEEQAQVRQRLHEVGQRASTRHPLAWLRLEPHTTEARTDLRLTTWPSGEERLLAEAGFHAGRARWLGPRRPGGAADRF
ncbi:MAG: DUF2332 domain-containing protein [Acidimicrobiia bacterium]|nr:DUF2332 domain-containing protein [Acidimicrobiia bacterium]